jgi:hypothetical protein
MNKQTTTILSVLLLILLAATLLSACGTSNSSSSSNNGNTGAALDGKGLMQERCSVCHSTSRITSAHKTAAEWKTTVDQMIQRGAQLSSSEEQTLIDYLAQNYK